QLTEELKVSSKVPVAQLPAYSLYVSVPPAPALIPVRCAVSFGLKSCVVVKPEIPTLPQWSASTPVGQPGGGLPPLSFVSQTVVLSWSSPHACTTFVNAAVTGPAVQL